MSDESARSEEAQGVEAAFSPLITAHLVHSGSHSLVRTYGSAVTPYSFLCSTNQKDLIKMKGDPYMKKINDLFSQ